SSREADELRERYAEWLLERKHPSLLLLHLLGLDHAEHESGPFSRESLLVLEQLDGLVGRLRQAAGKAAPGRAYLAVVSDHGFAAADRQLNLNVAFREEKLLTQNDKGKVVDWKAMAWETGGSAAILLKDPGDRALLETVRRLLDRLAADPGNG